MHSKWKIWDYLKNFPDGFDSSKTGIFAFSCNDTLISSLIKSSFPKNYFHENKLYSMAAKEISVQWFEDNFQTLGLFGNQESYIFNNANQLSAQLKNQIQLDNLILDGRYLFLFFDKSDELFKVLTKIDHINTIDIQAPAFWENDKLLEFLANYLKVRLSFEAKTQILNSVENSSLQFYNILTRLSVNYQSNVVNVQMLEELLEKNRLDNFELAKLFGFKKMKEFYRILIDVDPDYDSLRSLFYFLQTHMLKIADPSYVKEKKRPTKYDNQIVSQSKIWQANELEQVISYLKSIEVQAKLKNQYVKEQLKSGYLRALTS